MAKRISYHRGALKKTESGFTNSWGVKFSQEEVKDFRKKVARVNARRNKIRAEAAALQPVRAVKRKRGGRIPDEVVLSTYKRRSTIATWKTRQEFDIYKAKVEKEAKKDYLGEIVRQYKRNYIASINNIYGNDGTFYTKPIITRIQRMSHEKFTKLVNSGELPTISFIYNEEALQERLQEIADALGMEDLDNYD